MSTYTYWSVRTGPDGDQPYTYWTVRTGATPGTTTGPFSDPASIVIPSIVGPFSDPDTVDLVVPFVPPTELSLLTTEGLVSLELMLLE